MIGMKIAIIFMAIATISALDYVGKKTVKSSTSSRNNDFDYYYGYSFNDVVVDNSYFCQIVTLQNRQQRMSRAISMDIEWTNVYA